MSAGEAKPHCRLGAARATEGDSFPSAQEETTREEAGKERSELNVAQGAELTLLGR